MRDHDDVAPRIHLDQLVDCPRYPIDNIKKAFAARSRLMCRGVPKAMKIAATKSVQLLICEALPFARMLLGEIVDRNRVWAGNPLGPRQVGPEDRRRCPVSTAQIARRPNRAARQLPANPVKTGSLRTI